MDELADLRAHFFDVNSPRQFFGSLCRTVENLRKHKVKETDRLIYLILGLVHLREWIAPGYEYHKPANLPEEHFYNAIFELDQFKLLQALCNRSKHMAEFDGVVEAEYNSTVDDWPDFDAVANMDLGPATGYFVNGNNLLDVIDAVIKFYEQNWFANQQKA